MAHEIKINFGMASNTQIPSKILSPHNFMTTPKDNNNVVMPSGTDGP